MNEIEEIKQRLDLVDYIGQYVALKKAGANYKGVCPFHQEKTPSMMVSPQKQIWKCFGCGKGGDIFKFTMEAEHLEFGDALRLLAPKAGVTLQPRTKTEYQTQGRKERIFRVNMLAAKVFQKILKQSSQGKLARDYLAKRQVKPELIERFMLGYAPRGFELKNLLAKYEITAGDLQNAGNPEKFFDRIIFPIFDVLGNVVGFTGRTLGDNEPKYLNSPETAVFNKSRAIYGLNFAKAAIKSRDYVVLVEGQMDVIALHQAGAENVVASSGTAITETQLLTLAKYTNNFLLALDNDLAGQTATRKAIEVLMRLDYNAKVVNFGEFKDAGELCEQKPNEWPKLVKQASEGFDWLVDAAIKQAGSLQFIESKKQLIKELIPYLAGISDQARLDFYVDKLAQTAGTRSEAILQTLAKANSNSGPTTQQPAQTPVTKLIITPEEQLLAIILGEPKILETIHARFEEVVWQSVESQRIAEAVKSCYNKKTLANNRLQFIASVKTALNSQLDEKIDAWQFWLSSQWPELQPALATELATEKMTQLSTKTREQHKEQIALQIRRAQEQGDSAKVKQLMQTLNELTR